MNPDRLVDAALHIIGTAIAWHDTFDTPPPDLNTRQGHATRQLYAAVDTYLTEGDHHDRR